VPVPSSMISICVFRGVAVTTKTIP
jgi:hypothetical protein